MKTDDDKTVEVIEDGESLAEAITDRKIFAEMEE